MARESGFKLEAKGHARIGSSEGSAVAATRSWKALSVRSFDCAFDECAPGQRIAFAFLVISTMVQPRELTLQHRVLGCLLRMHAQIVAKRKVPALLLATSRTHVIWTMVPSPVWLKVRVLPWPACCPSFSSA